MGAIFGHISQAALDAETSGPVADHFTVKQDLTLAAFAQTGNNLSQFALPISSHSG